MRRKSGGPQLRSRRVNMRPVIVEEKVRAGNREGDMIAGVRCAALSLADRASGFALPTFAEAGHRTGRIPREETLALFVTSAGIFQGRGITPIRAWKTANFPRRERRFPNPSRSATDHPRSHGPALPDSRHRNNPQDAERTAADKSGTAQTPREGFFAVAS